MSAPTLGELLADPDIAPHRRPGRLATALMDLGLTLIPILPGTKVPACPWRAFQTAPAPPERMGRWLGRAMRLQEFNFAVVTGRVSQVVVVDTDTSEGDEWVRAHLPESPFQVRTRRGLHRYYRHPGGHVRCRKLAPGVDLKADGGYVLAPGAPHPEGMRYEPIGPWCAAEWSRLPVFPTGVAQAPAAPQLLILKSGGIA